MTPQLFDYALNTLWQLPLLAAATWLLIRLTRPTPFLQHLLWIATLLTGATLPLRGTLPSVSPLPYHGAIPASPLPSAPHLVLLTPTLIHHIVQLWTLALAFNLLRLAYAWVTARRLIAASQPLSPGALDPAILQTCADRLQIPVPEIRLTASSTPVIAGILHPVLLLPAELAHDYELATILLHEFAHIRRRDTLANLLCRLVALPIAWHPVTPILHTRINQTREILCDALAAEATGSPTAYARSLLILARDLQRSTHPTLTQTLFSSNPSALEERIMTLIAPRTPAHRATRLATGVALVLAATTVAASFHLQPAHAATARPTPPLRPISSITPPLPPAPAAAPTAPEAPALQTPQAPPAPPAQKAPPAVPAPAPPPADHASIWVNGTQRDLTPEERDHLREQLAGIHDKVQAALSQHRLDQQQLKIQLKQLDLPNLDRQLATINQQLASPDFQKRLADASSLAADQVLRSTSMQSELQRAADQIRIAQARIADEHILIDSDSIQQQVKAAADAASHIHIHIDSDQPASPQALAQFQQQLQAARETLHQELRSAAGDPAAIQQATDRFAQKVQATGAAMAATNPR